MVQDIYLTAPYLSPSTIYLRGANMTYGFRPLTRTTPNTNSFSLAETQTAGFENPKILIGGYIDTDNLSPSTIQHSSLLALAKNPYDGTSNTEINLIITTGKNSVPLYSTDAVSIPSGSSIYTTTASSSTIKVVVESFDLGAKPSSSKYGHLVNYKLTFVETS
ncbi:hypothetical protein [uncultured Arcobacter sp.]|uniref:hypothetical protein n=1 Tax=uncultured Arcobacter sp. TaxID=165434 RepID=UPI002626CFE4|nr:hypothetical protein [uncultured Arcobacter sp.]